MLYVIRHIATFDGRRRNEWNVGKHNIKNEDTTVVGGEVGC